MDHAQQSTSSAGLSPRERRRPAPLSVTEKTMVQNLFKHVFNEEENKLETHLNEKPNKRHCAQKTADILGIGTATVFNVLKDIKENVTPTPPQPSGPKLTKDKMDDFTHSDIQHKVDGFLFNKEAPTIIKSELTTSAESPSIKRLKKVKRLGKIRHAESSQTESNQLNYILSSILRLEKISSRVSEKEDEYDLFGRSIALHLKKMPEHAGLELMQKIQSLVTNMRINCSQNKDVSEVTNSEKYGDRQIEIFLEPH